MHRWLSLWSDLLSTTVDQSRGPVRLASTNRGKIVGAYYSCDRRREKERDGHSYADTVVRGGIGEEWLLLRSEGAFVNFSV